MAINLFPKDTSFMDPFIKLSDKIVEATSVLLESIQSDEQNKALRDAVSDIEVAGDGYRKEITIWVSKAFITPYNRDDMFRIAGALDDILDSIDDIAGTMYLYQVDGLPKRLVNEITIIAKMASITKKAMKQFDKIDELEWYWEEIYTLYEDATRNHRKAISKLLENEDLKPTSVFKFSAMLTSIDQTTKAYKSLANTLENTALKES
jgi:predicted phosphate transport protein (TIGR00153 family)